MKAEPIEADLKQEKADMQELDLELPPFDFACQVELFGLKAGFDHECAG